MNRSFLNTTDFPEEYFEEYFKYHRMLRNMLAGFFGVYCPLVVISNLLLIVAVLKNRKLRREFSHRVIVSIAVSDLLIGLLLFPYEIDRAIHQRYRGDCYVYTTMDIIESYVNVFVGTWGIILININYLLDVTNRKPELAPLTNTFVAAVGLIMPWIASCIILPIAYSHGVFKIKRWGNICVSYALFPMKATIFVLSFILPTIVIIIQVIIMAALHAKRAGRVMPLSRREGILPWKVLVGASLTTVFLMSTEAYSDFDSLHMAMSLDAYTYTNMLVSIHIVANVKAWILPLIWLLSPDLRAYVKELLPRSPCRKIDQSQSQTGVNVTYVNLSEDL